MVSEKRALIHRAFYAQAVADAMGENFEFVNPGRLEVRTFMCSVAPIHLTDDTQMAMFGQEAVNRARSLVELPREIEQAYLRWYGTQLGYGFADFGLAMRREMQVCRAPGNRCMSSLAAIKAGRLPNAEQGRGCGPVMRLLPLAALLFDHALAEVAPLAEASCRVTHTHPDAVAATQRYMEVANFLIEGGDCANLGMTGERIEDHGQGWLADECVEMAVWAVQNAKNYDELLEVSIAHSGDSDSVAAVAGSLWGLAGLRGYERYLSRLAERDAIDSLFTGP